MSNGEVSTFSSRDNSSGDLKKKVHFNRAKDDSGLELNVKQFGGHESGTLTGQDLDEVARRLTSKAKTKGLLKPAQAHVSHGDHSQGLFFLEEDSDDATDVPVTPFKKTGKIKTTVKPSLSPTSQPLSNLQSESYLDPFATPNLSSTSLNEIVDYQEETPHDIPMVQMSHASGSVAPSGITASLGRLSKAQAPLSGRSSVDGIEAQYEANSISPSLPITPELESVALTNLTLEHKKTNLEAYKLVRAHTIQARDENVSKQPFSRRNSFVSTVGSDATEVGADDQLEAIELDSSKKHVSRGGVLSNLMQLYNSTVYQQPPGTKPRHGGDSSGTSTPKWHQRNSQSNTSLTALLSAAQSLGSLGMQSQNSSQVSLHDTMAQRPPLSGRKHSGGFIGAVRQSFLRPRIDAELRITMAIADVLQRQKFVLKLCKALMLFGAPTHRLEDYLKLTSRALEIDAQFLYIPGCMIVAFDDRSTHTSDVKLVRVVQGIDLGKLNEVHTIYKNVLHGIINVDQGIRELDDQLEMPQLYKVGFVLFAYGLAAVCVGPFAFGSSFIDLPIQFLLGLVVGVLQLIVAPRSQLYANVFEIIATIVVSFVGRGFGSIRKKDSDEFVFCFAALAQSSIALILPGYMVLCGALELQSKSIVAGSVRLLYAIVFSLFLSFGITIGSVMYGWMDTGATKATTCTSDISDYWRILFVPGFALCLLIVNQARPRQAPVALFIASAGYTVNFFSNRKFGAAQVSNALAAFVIGCLGNLYSRIGHGLAFTAVLPSIFVQVPSGLASGSSLVAGLDLANSILNNTANSTYGSDTIASSGAGALQFGYAMLQIAIGITVGLFASALVIYIPLCFGEKRTGMLTF